MLVRGRHSKADMPFRSHVRRRRCPACHFHAGAGVGRNGRRGRSSTKCERINMPPPLTQVLVRGRLHTVRGKGKSAFLVLRQSATSATVQAVLFVDDKTVSKVSSARAYPTRRCISAFSQLRRPSRLRSHMVGDRTAGASQRPGCKN